MNPTIDRACRLMNTTDEAVAGCAPDDFVLPNGLAGAALAED
jgi:hypothetical protein